MSGDFNLKPIHPATIPAALEKAEQYRRLNEPGQAESICLDILAIDAENQDALRVLILALTDKFVREYSSASVQHTRQYIARLTSEYEKLYFAGIVHERSAKAFLARGMSSSFAYDGFRNAMECYEQAEKIRPENDDNCILRWNSCVRAIERERLEPHEDMGELPLE